MYLQCATNIYVFSQIPGIVDRDLINQFAGEHLKKADSNHSMGEHDV